MTTRKYLESSWKIVKNPYFYVPAGSLLALGPFLHILVLLVWSLILLSLYVPEALRARRERREFMEQTERQNREAETLEQKRQKDAERLAEIEALPSAIPVLPTKEEILAEKMELIEQEYKRRMKLAAAIRDRDVRSSQEERWRLWRDRLLAELVDL